MAVTSRITHAMAAQLDRVNGENLRERVAQQEEIIRRLRAENQQLRQQLGELAASTGTTMHDNRRVLTVQQAAERAGVSRSTVCRYLKERHWEGVRVPGSNRWMVYADQPLKSKKG